eukprot:TRINITY_DN2841_c0_g1_i1.p1 TRINITY_DN2841_c0_g1~~TRINITY_DN2841_c0_g1_i1.p1  ORF type:complete len:168 (-),score=32.49 TRINITY_DN2841_c0_g1_i1:94-597(-)
MDGEQAVFSFSKSALSTYDFEKMESSVKRYNERTDPQFRIPLSSLFILGLKKVIASAYLKKEDLKLGNSYTRKTLSSLFLIDSKVRVEVDVDVVIDELVERRLVEIIKKDDDNCSVVFDLEHLGRTGSDGGSYLKTVLCVFVVVLFWWGLIESVLSVNRVGGRRPKK